MSRSPIDVVLAAAAQAHDRQIHARTGPQNPSEVARSEYLSAANARALMAAEPDGYVIEALAENRHLPPDLLAELLRTREGEYAAAGNPRTRYRDVLTYAPHHAEEHPDHPRVEPAAGDIDAICHALHRCVLGAHPVRHEDFTRWRAEAQEAGAADEALFRLDQAWAGSRAADPAWLREIADRGVHVFDRELAINTTTPPAILADLMTAPDIVTRCAASANPGTPAEALVRAAADRGGLEPLKYASRCARIALNPAAPLEALHHATVQDLLDWQDDGLWTFAAAHTRDGNHTAAVLAAAPSWAGTLAELLTTTAAALDLPYCPGAVLDTQAGLRTRMRAQSAA